MKKYLLILCVFAGLFMAAQTAPRYGTTAYTDNTGRVLTYALITTTDVTSATIDTLNFIPNAWETIWRPSANLADSCIVKLSSTITNYRVGDSFSIILTKGTGDGRIRFGGSKVVLTTTIATGVAIAANKKLWMTLRWDGTVWMETSRCVKP